MSEIVDQSLQKIAKGAGIIFVGTIVSILLGFAGRVIIVRYITQSEYGIYSLVLVIIGIFALISTLGLPEGSARQIAYYRGKRDTLKVRGIVSSSIQLSLTASIVLSIVCFFASGFVSTEIFHNSGLSAPLKIFSFTLPFLTLITIFASIFRGFDRVDARIYFENILRSALFPLLLGGVILLNLSFLGVIYAYVASIVVTCIALVIYTIKKLPVPIGGKVAANPARKDLLFFSLPLLGVNMIMMILVWADTLMLGYFKTPELVGLYNAALPLANLIPIILISVIFLYVPIASELYARDEKEQMKREFAILTKWIFLGTLPIFFILFLFPDTILNLFFGSQYVAAAISLQILTLGFFLNPATGPKFHAMIVIGKSRDLMWIFLVSTLMNIALNYLLIPPLGIVGAAIASASSVAVANTVILIRLYQLSEIHPVTKNYFKSIILAALFIGIVYATKHLLVISLWMPFAFLALFMMVYGLSLLLAKSFDKEDITLLLQIEKRLGVNLTWVKGVLKRLI